ncbi:hypothetical protein AAFX91_21910 [Bradyrhizobium sp. 31Argb]|uniref:hypothetical protein n=1 Tax=Bradyrhizobium sp. 31Argb TaxID=3141247 RepID=UPI00374A239C
MAGCVHDAADVIADTWSQLSWRQGEDRIDAATSAFLADDDLQRLWSAGSGCLLLSGQRAKLLVHVHTDKALCQNARETLSRATLGLTDGKIIQVLWVMPVTIGTPLLWKCSAQLSASAVIDDRTMSVNTQVILVSMLS